MLSRLADHLFWMSRYLERAENTVRMLDVAQALVMTNPELNRSTLFAPLAHTGLNDLFEERYDELSLVNLLEFFTMDETNPSSVYQCFKQARENAHAARGKINMETWEGINSTWLEMQARKNRGLQGWNVNELFDWVKTRCHIYRGTTGGTFVRTDAYQFTKLGSSLERADNTARILLVRFGEDMDEELDLPGTEDFYALTALLRSMSVFESYQEIYRGELAPDKILELLIFRADLPRSLRWCVKSIMSTFLKIEGDAGISVKRRCAELEARLSYGSVDDLRDQGVVSYLEHFLDAIHDIGAGIRTEYLEAV